MKSGRFLSICCFGLLTLLNIPQASHAQSKTDERLRFEIKAIPQDSAHPVSLDNPLKVRRGQVVKIVFNGTPMPGYHTYPLTKRTARQESSQISRLEFGKMQGITPLWPVSETEPERHFSKEFKGVIFEHAKPFTWSQDVLVGADAPTGPLNLPIKLRTYECDDKNSCLPNKRFTTIALEVTPEDPMPVPPALSARVSEKMPEVVVVTIPGEPEIPDVTLPSNVTPAPPKPDSGAGTTPKNAAPTENAGLISGSHEEYKAKIEAITKQIEVSDVNQEFSFTDLVNFMLAGVFWGAISLITPCVFPMIPITVSFFLKQSEKEHHRPVVLASVYSLTIVVVLTLAAAFMLSIFRWLSVNPITNYFLGGLFIFFALSLFGMYEIELPNSLAQFTSAREGKGGLVGTIFMALTFTIISFACVAPFLGGFSGTAAAARPIWHNLLGGLAFSATFASPFFFLALFPTLLRKMPKSGSWLNSVKVVMGFLELAAAFKFFRAAELFQTNGSPTLFTFDFVLGIWISLCVLSGLYLLNMYRLPHDSPMESIGVTRLLFSAAFLGLAFYLAPALLKINTSGQSQRPDGAVFAWIDSFLLPEFQAGEIEIPHTANLDFAVTTARAERNKTGKAKRIFIDFTGVGCVNCVKNERSVFSRPAIAKLFDPYVVVKIYTDTIPKRYYAPEELEKIAKDPIRPREDAEEVNALLQKTCFGGEQLPLYAIVEPDAKNSIRVVATYGEALINNVPEFAEFLQNPEKYQKNH